MSVLAHMRRVLARRPWLYWAAVASLAVLAGVLVSRAASEVEAARDAWGESRRVVVATADIEPGQLLGGATERRDLPTPMIPVGALDDIEPGATAIQRIAAGEIVMAHDAAATSGPQAFMPEGWLAVAVAEPVPSGARTGDAISVASGGIVVANDSVVVGTAGEAVLVAVPSHEAALVAQAAATGDVALLIKG